MNLIICFIFLLSVGYSTSLSRGDLEKFGPFRGGMGMKLKCDHSKNVSLDVSKTQVYFYDFQNNLTRDFPVNKAAQGILTIPNLDRKKKFFIIVNGFRSFINDTEESRARETFKKLPNSYLIIVDHSHYTNSGDSLLNIPNSYDRAVKHVYYIAQQLSQTLVELHKGGISNKNIHCIGHSLGSHILGYTGFFFIKATGHKIWRITALDPAGPCFQDNPIEDQVRSGLAEHVEVYHCNKHVFGTVHDHGDVNFYINNGKAQADCGTPLIPDLYFSAFAAQCSHSFCIKVWLNSVANKSKYLATECERYKYFMENKCQNNTKTTAGFWNPGNATGKYYFSTY